MLLILKKLWPKSRSCCSRSSGACDFAPSGAFHNLLFIAGLINGLFHLFPSSLLTVRPWQTILLPHLSSPSLVCLTSLITVTTRWAYLAVAVASELWDEADVVVSDLDHLLTDVVLGTYAALSARPPGQKSKGFKDRTWGSTQTPPGTKPCPQLLSSFQHAQDMPPPGQMSASVVSLMSPGVGGLPEVVSHSTMGTLASPFSPNISAPSTLKAALHVGLTCPHGQRWLFSRPPLDKLSGKDELQRPSIICILSAKPKVSHPLRGYPSRSEMAGSHCLLLWGKTLQGASKGMSLPPCFWFWLTLPAQWTILSINDEQNMIKWTRFSFALTLRYHVTV